MNVELSGVPILQALAGTLSGLLLLLSLVSLVLLLTLRWVRQTPSSTEEMILQPAPIPAAPPGVRRRPEIGRCTCAPTRAPPTPLSGRRSIPVQVRCLE